VPAIYQILIARFGGLAGVREEGLLESALEKPFSGFGELNFTRRRKKKRRRYWKV
jgi:death on curing protein